jgi:hypothetical protein
MNEQAVVSYLSKNDTKALQEKCEQLEIEVKMEVFVFEIINLSLIFTFHRAH